MPAFLPDWMPWWVQLLLWMAGVVIVLGWIAMPFIVIGLRARLTYVSEQLDEVHAELRMVAQRMPEPISAARYEALRAHTAPEVTRGAADDAAYRMPPQRPVYPPQRPPEPGPDRGYDGRPREPTRPYDEPPPRREQQPPPNPAFRAVLPPRAPLSRPPPAPGEYGGEYGDEDYGPDAHGDGDPAGGYERRLSPPFRDPPPPRDPPRHEPRLRWPPRED